MKIIPGQKKDIKEIELWFSIDMGFSTKNKTCGIFYPEGKKENIIYGNLFDEFKSFAKEEKNKIGLIIEAPLSYYLDEKGNPKGREKPKEKDGEKTRYWYTGSGSSVLIAALMLLKKIHDHKDDKKIVYLYEGFLSFKGRPDNEKKSNHYDDAEKLYEQRGEVIEPASDYIGIMSLLSNDENAKKAPSIIVSSESQI
ncbi:MAG TPA: hypothetical protein VIS94_17395 [Desulfomonilia bacterium]